MPTLELPRADLWQRLPGKGTPMGPLEILQARSDPVGWMDAQYRRYGPVVRIRFFAKRMVLMLGPDANEFVLADPHRLFINRPAVDWFIGAFFRDGLYLRDLAEHDHHRQIMRKAFTRDALARYLELMGPHIEEEMDGLTEFSRSGRPLLTFPWLRRLTLRLAWSAFVGEPLGADSHGAGRAFADSVRAVGAVFRYPLPGTLWWRALRGRDRLEQYFRERVCQRRMQATEDVFSVLARATDLDGRRMSDKDVVDHMIFLMVAAHDTTAVAMATMLYYLAFHPEWQEACRDELAHVDTAAPAAASLDALEATDRVLKESVRLVPPVPALPRVAVRDFEFCGQRVPRDTIVCASPTHTHHMSQFWSAPEVFDPERFSPERAEDRRHPYLYLPFGAGAHGCVGGHFASNEIKYILAALLRRYRLVPVNHTYPLRLSPSLPRRPHDDLPLRLELVV